MSEPQPTTKPRTVFRVLLGLLMLIAGTAHLTVARKTFQAQVPDYLTPIASKDTIVVASGVVEIALGKALFLLPKHRKRVGQALALFFAAIFVGNVDQFVQQRDGFGLDTDAKRLARLPLQPVLIALALWSTTPKRRA